MLMYCLILLLYFYIILSRLELYRFILSPSKISYKDLYKFFSWNVFQRKNFPEMSSDITETFLTLSENEKNNTLGISPSFFLYVKQFLWRTEQLRFIFQHEHFYPFCQFNPIILFIGVPTFRPSDTLYNFFEKWNTFLDGI